MASRSGVGYESVVIIVGGGAAAADGRIRILSTSSGPLGCRPYSVRTFAFSRCCDRRIDFFRLDSTLSYRSFIFRDREERICGLLYFMSFILYVDVREEKF